MNKEPVPVTECCAVGTVSGTCFTLIVCILQRQLWQTRSWAGGLKPLMLAALRPMITPWWEICQVAASQT